VGEQAAIESMGEILDALAGPTKMAFIVAGWGKEPVLCAAANLTAQPVKS
jgi:cell division GTPase FtsZ